MKRILKMSLLTLLFLASYFFIIIGIGTDGISECEPGAIVMYLIGCAGYGWFFGSLVSKLVKEGFNRNDNSRNQEQY